MAFTYGSTSNGATRDRKNSNGARFLSFSSFFLIASGSVRICSRSSSAGGSWATARPARNKTEHYRREKGDPGSLRQCDRLHGVPPSTPAAGARWLRRPHRPRTPTPKRINPSGPTSVTPREPAPKGSRRNRAVALRGAILQRAVRPRQNSRPTRALDIDSRVRRERPFQSIDRRPARRGGHDPHRAGREPARARSIAARPGRSTRKPGKARDHTPGRAGRGRDSHPDGRQRRSRRRDRLRPRSTRASPRTLGLGACRRRSFTSVKAKAGTASAARATGMTARHDARAVKGPLQRCVRSERTPMTTASIA